MHSNRSMLIIATTATLVFGAAYAQQNPPSSTATPAPSTTVQNPPAKDGPTNPAVKTTEGNNPGAPVAGANSFTEGQAKARIEDRGYANVSELKKDDAGVWRGKAQKDGRTLDVSLDYQGNVVANP